MRSPLEVCLFDSVIHGLVFGMGFGSRVTAGRD
jgi:hypothetical protein